MRTQGPLAWPQSPVPSNSGLNTLNPTQLGFSTWAIPPKLSTPPPQKFLLFIYRINFLSLVLQFLAIFKVHHHQLHGELFGASHLFHIYLFCNELPNNIILEYVSTCHQLGHNNCKSISRQGILPKMLAGQFVHC